jgi:glycolate oxidase FAD binding subunit
MRSVAELAEAVRSAPGPFVVRGGGSKQDWGGAPDGSAYLDVADLREIVDHAAGDLVVTAQAGVRLADLQAALAGAGQWLALDPPEAGATLGGIVATAATGPRRLLYGGPRDLLIGTTFVLADGTVARAGGTVVKNVAGYDLCKLFCGSYGTLAVLAELTFRLHPLPEAGAVVVVETPTPADVGRAVAGALHSQAVASAIDYADGRVTVLIEGVEAGVGARAASMAEAIGGEIAGTVPEGFGSRPWGEGEVGIKVAAEVAAVPQVLEALRAAGATRVSGPAGVGVLYAALAAVDDVPPLREAIAGHDGSVVVLHASEEDRRRVDPWGPVAGLALMRRVKERFDPQRRLAPGRFVGGI